MVTLKNYGKRELDILASCRTYKEINESNIIDPIIKQDFINDLMGYYMTIVDARGGEFLLSDIYPTSEIYPIIPANIHMHILFPLSPTRMLLLNHIMFKKENQNNQIFVPMIKRSQIKEDAIIPPKSNRKSSMYLSPDDEFVYKVRKIYAENVEYINALFLNETRVGIIFRDKDRIINSLKVFNERNDTKQSFKKLEGDII